MIRLKEKTIQFSFSPVGSWETESVRKRLRILFDVVVSGEAAGDCDGDPDKVNNVM